MHSYVGLDLGRGLEKLLQLRVAAPLRGYGQLQTGCVSSPRSRLALGPLGTPGQTPAGPPEGTQSCGLRPWGSSTDPLGEAMDIAARVKDYLRTTENRRQTAAS